MIRGVWALLQPAERRTAVRLFGLMIAGSILETMGIGLIIPALGLLTDPSAASAYMPRWLATRGTADLVIFGMLALAVVYLVKNAFLGLLAWLLNKYTFDVIAHLSERLFTHYLRQPYVFHLQRNSAELIRNAVVDVDVFTGSIIRPGLQLLAEALTTIGLISLVLVVEPVGALLVATVAVAASLVFHWTVKSHVQRWGEARQQHAGLRLQHLQQGLGGAKDVKLLGREAEFIEHFRVQTKRYVRVSSLQNTVLELPRLWVELLTVTALATVVIGLVLQGKATGTILPMLGLFAAAAFRLMPGLNRIIASLQSLKYGRPVVATLTAELSGAEEHAATRASAPALPLRDRVTIENLVFSFPNTDAPVLRNVSLTVRAGEMAGIIGESGAGKSTLVDVLLGLLTPDSGAVRVDGIDIQSNLRGWQNEIGYVPQTIFLTDDCIRRNVAFGIRADEIDEAAVWRALDAAQLTDFVRALPNGLDSAVGERGVRISGGQRQRIGIARALYHDPAVLVLDEATSSLDPATEGEVMNAVQALHGRKTIIIVSHRFSTVEDCDRLFRLEAGCVVEAGHAHDVLRTQVTQSNV